METHAEFQTRKASQYLASLCKHFGRKVPVQTNGITGQIEFPFGQCALTAREDALNLSVTADTEANLEKAAEVIGSHLERFAFREAPEITWHAPRDGTPAN